MRTLYHNYRGFTLIEMIVVMVITGIIGGMVAIFIQAPVKGYMDSSRRAEMTDIADTSLRRIARDIRTAVPNSIRVANCGLTPCVEFLPTKAGGRYRADIPGNILYFGSPGGTSTFDIIGPAINFAAGDYIVIGSQQSDGDPPYGNPPSSDTVAGNILRAYTGGAGLQTTVSFTPIALPVWAEVLSHRFAVVDGTQQAVTYACVGVGTNVATGDGTGSLNRYSSYGFKSAQATPGTLGVAPALLADRISACTIAYNPVNQRDGLVEITLTITRANENINLTHAIHVNNVP